jgi:hypothetical protein
VLLCDCNIWLKCLSFSNLTSGNFSVNRSPKQKHTLPDLRLATHTMLAAVWQNCPRS